MEIKTKFNIGDTCYKIINNYNIKKYIIRSIDIAIKTKVTIMYELEDEGVCEDESMLFKDINDIINHFQQEIITTIHQ